MDAIMLHLQDWLAATETICGLQGENYLLPETL
jgi:hypothetical protein